MTEAAWHHRAQAIPLCVAALVAVLGCTSETPSPAPTLTLTQTTPPATATETARGTAPSTPGTPLPTASASPLITASPPAATPPLSATATVPICGGGCAGQTLYLLKSETDFDYYDPQRIALNEDLAFFGATIIRSLVAYRYSPDLAEATTLVPDMATDTGRPSADATSWSFTLRDGVAWQDGSPVRCEDIKYGVSRTFATDVINGGPTYAIAYLDIPKNDDGSSQYPGPYSASADQQALFDSAVACDGNTIIFDLAQSVPDFNYATTSGFGAVPNPVDHPGVDTGETYGGLDVWSDGPYRITSYMPVKGGALILERNDGWSPAGDPYRSPYVDKWEVDFGLDAEKIDKRLIESAGNDAFALGYGPVQPGDLSTIFADPHTAQPAFAGRAFSTYDQYVHYYWINTRTVPNRDIRAAMAVALDRDAIRQTLGGEFYGDFADGAIKPSIGQDYAPTSLWDTLLGKEIPQGGDPEHAKALIAQSGVPAPKVGWSYFSTPQRDVEAAIIKSSLERAGLEVELDPLPEWGCAGCMPPYMDFSATGWGADWPNASTVIPPIFTEEGGFDYSQVDDSSGIPDWTARVADARTTSDRAAQAAKWQQLNRDAAGQVWIIPMFFDLTQSLAGGRVGGLYRWPARYSWPYGQLYAKPVEGQ